MQPLKITIGAFIFSMVVGCATNDSYRTPDLSGECTDIVATKNIADIIATPVATPFLTEEIIEAYVTSSDEGGNFYKSISFISLDGTVGFSVPVDHYNLYTQYEPGRKVSLHLKGLYYVLQQSAPVIGSLYNGGVGRISGVEYESFLNRSCTKVDETTIVKHLSITQAKNNQYLNALIELDNVQFTTASIGKKYFDPTLNSFGGATNHQLTDGLGNKIILRVSEFAKFSGNSVPSLNGKVRGVLTKYGSDFQFLIRTLADVNMTNNRMPL